MATIAILGLNGFLGKPIVESLLSEQFVSKVKAPIRLLTTSDKKPIESSKVEYINVKDQKLDEYLKGIDVFINLVGFPQGHTDEILNSVVSAKVKLYIPSQFGTNAEAAQSVFPNILQGKIDHSSKARKAGLKTIDFNTSLFYASFGGPYLSPLVQLDGTKATVIGDGKTLINPSTFNDIGNAVAVVATSDDYSKLPNKIRIYSDKVTVEDLIAKYEKDHDVKLTIEYTSSEEFYKEITDKYNKDGFNPADFLKYLAAVFVAGEGKGNIYETANEKEIINPNESLFKWTKLSEFPKI